MKKAIVAILIVISQFFCHISLADGNNITLIRDAETENLLYTIAKPLFITAGLNPDNVKIHIVQDTALNAFVAAGQNMFINTGTISKAENVDELIGVIAHETGHMYGGHIARGSEALSKAQANSLAAVVLGGIAGVATGRGDVAAALVMGGQSSTMGSYMSYRQSEERAADQFAIKALNENNISIDGLTAFMSRIKNNELLISNSNDSYYRTHPLTSERITFLRNASATQKNAQPISANINHEFALVKAKLTGYTEDYNETLSLYPLSNKSEEALYARSVAYYRIGNFSKSLKEVSKLINITPNYPYFYELKGQIAFESGDIQVAEQAYQVAYNELPDNALIASDYAKTLVESTDTAKLKKAAEILEKAVEMDTESSENWKRLAKVYSNLNQQALAYYCSSEYLLLTGDKKTAKSYAIKAKKSSYKFSKTRLMRIEDIINFSEDEDKHDTKRNKSTN